MAKGCEVSRIHRPPNYFSNIHLNNSLFRSDVVAAVSEFLAAGTDVHLPLNHSPVCSSTPAGSKISHKFSFPNFFLCSKLCPSILSFLYLKKKKSVYLMGFSQNNTKRHLFTLVHTDSNRKRPPASSPYTSV